MNKRAFVLSLLLTLFFGQAAEAGVIRKAAEWTWNHGPRQVWQHTGLPVFHGFCRAGKWSERTGFTAGLQMIGGAASVATPVVLGVKRGL